MTRAVIRESLPLLQRLALAYAPAQSRDVLLVTLGLDLRLAQVVTGAREPILGQIRMAWWRDRLADNAVPVTGEPLLELLHETGTDRQVLRALVDAWEGLLGEDTAAALEALASARADALCAAAENHQGGAGARTAAREWALYDLTRIPGSWGALAAHLCDGMAWESPRIVRSLRPVAVLHALARRARQTGRPGPDPGSIMVALRVGLLGR